MTLSMRIAGLVDVPTLIAMSEAEPNAPRWTAPTYEHSIQQSGSGSALLYCVCAGTSIVGFYVARRLAGRDWELESILVAPECRGQGIGHVLMRDLFARLRALQAERLLLEVRESNLAARRLYARLGFSEDGKRRNYYSHPEEDAVLLSLALV
jgi:ribosomal-protein-alanine N-acetyltransferase